MAARLGGMATEERFLQEKSATAVNNWHNAPMNFVLTNHAETEATRRQIPREWIEATMANPEQVTPGVNQRKVFQSRIVADGRAYLIRLIVEDWHQPPVVVTVYRTSKIEKYWSKA